MYVGAKDDRDWSAWGFGDPWTWDEKLKKVIFGTQIHESRWPNAVVASGDLADEVNALKAAPGRNLIVYGGAGFASSLIKADLVDEFHLYVNPAAIGDGLPIFSEAAKDDTFRLSLIDATPYSCGVAVLKYAKA